MSNAAGLGKRTSSALAEVVLEISLLRNINPSMGWVVEYTDEFGAWWDTLTEAEQITVAAHVQKLESRGPNLPFP
jgi:hypothetical protein